MRSMEHWEADDLGLQLFGVWFVKRGDYETEGEWLRTHDGTIFHTEHYPVAAAMTRYMEKQEEGYEFAVRGFDVAGYPRGGSSAYS